MQRPLGILIAASMSVAALVAMAIIALGSPAVAEEAAPAPVCNINSLIMPLADNHYVSAELGYGGALYGMLRSRAATPGPWENFKICYRYEGATKVVYILNERNLRYVSAELGYTGVDHGMLRARATDVGPWEKFTIARWGPNPKMYTIQSQRNGRYVSVELGYGGVRHGMLRARATAIGPWEKFLISCGFPAECKF
jgi:hypothetical protein